MPSKQRVAGSSPVRDARQRRFGRKHLEPSSHRLLRSGSKPAVQPAGLSKSVVATSSEIRSPPVQPTEPVVICNVPGHPPWTSVG